MTWATISLRKMELKNRINELESEDLKISQELQTLSRKSSDDEKADQLESNYNQSLLYADYQEAMDLVSKNGGDDNVKKQQALMVAQQNYSQKMNIFKSLQESKSNAKRDITDSQAKALEARKEQLETQLKAARAEYESLGQAMDQDIQQGAIKLV